MAKGHPDRKQHSSKVKQFKRWILNDQTDYKSYFLPYAKSLLAQLSKQNSLVFSIDGSTVGRGCMCLMISVIYKDKAIPIVWKTYKAKKGHLSQAKHRSLLKELIPLVPAGCEVVMTGDGEFDGCDWQADIEAEGWNYVLKTSKNAIIYDSAKNEFKAYSTLPEKGRSLFFENIFFSKKEYPTNLVVWHGKSHKAPLYLLTSLDYTPVIQQLYKKRFKIEPFFRDQKSNGFHIHKSGLSCPQRLDKLLLASCMAYVICVMAGIKGRLSKLYKEFARADMESLSLFQLGYRFLLFLVDIRQWRAFSIKKDLEAEHSQLKNIDICVPF